MQSQRSSCHPHFQRCSRVHKHSTTDKHSALGEDEVIVSKSTDTCSCGPEWQSIELLPLSGWTDLISITTSRPDRWHNLAPVCWPCASPWGCGDGRAAVTFAKSGGSAPVVLEFVSSHLSLMAKRRAIVKGLYQHVDASVSKVARFNLRALTDRMFCAKLREGAYNAQQVVATGYSPLFSHAQRGSSRGKQITMIKRDIKWW